MKNPKEFYCAHGKNIFCAFNELTSPKCEDGSEPLMFHHETFSRFHFVLFNEANNVVTANIPVSEMPGIFSAINEQMLVSKISKRIQSQSNSCDDVDTTSAAYNTRIASGKLKGKTPSAALLESADNEQLLKNQVTWLESNLSKYPKNKEQINAINEALSLYHSGKLVSGAVIDVQDKTVIYPGGLRPLVRRKKENGKAFVYQISIYMYEDDKKPIQVTVKNFYAPVIKTEAGLFNVQAKDRENEVEVSFQFTLSEWKWFEHQVETQMRTFENITAPALYKTANNAEYVNRQNAGLK